MTPFSLSLPACPPAPLVVDSPHSGRDYPADFDHACALPLLRQTEDFLVDELITGATRAGATLLAANFPRCYIDVNRAEDDIDPALLVETWPTPLAPSERTLQGLGLVRRLCKSGVPVYDAPLPIGEIQNRIRGYYRPYHQALQNLVDKTMTAFGECYLVDCHSMPNRSIRDDRTHSDFVLGDRNGTGCDPSFTRRACQILQDMGYSVALNDPFKGMEIVHRYGQPHKGQHALQLEINRRLYVNETVLEKNRGFETLQRNMTKFFGSLASELVCDMPDRLAAE
jgi:N-formylglutamate deformylase